MTFRGCVCPLKLRFIVPFVFFLLLQQFSSTAARAASCDTSQITNHFTLVFEGVTYNFEAGSSKWDYTLIWDGHPPELSYFFIELCSLLTNENLVAVEPDFGSIGYNGNAKLYGIKWDDIRNFPADSPVLFSFTLDQLLAVDHTQFAPKAGVNQNIATICGPSIFCDILIDSCENNSSPAANCPGDTTIVAGEFTEICLNGFGAIDPDGNLASVLVIGGSFNNGTVCFTPVEGANVITLIAADSCGAVDTCNTTVFVRRNDTPVCQLPPDSSTIFICAGQDTCLIISALDPDDNLESCSIVSGPGQIADDTLWCYAPSGDETVTVTIECVDSLGLSCTDSFTVKFIVAKPPVIGEVEVTDVFLCNSEHPVCVQLSINSYGNPFEVVTALGEFNTQDSSLCFTADTSGLYCNRVIVTNNCGQADTIEYCIDVVINSAPVAVCPESVNIFACVFEGQVCLPGFEYFDTDSNYADVVVSAGILRGDTVCFLPFAGENVITLIVTDICGLADTCRTVVNVQLNTPPQVQVALRDTTVYLCQPSYVCLPVEFLDHNGNIAGVIVNRGTYTNGQVCFVPYDSGNYTIIATATDSCGAVVADTANVRVITNQFVNLVCPNDTSVFMCVHDTLCFPIGEIPEWAQVQVSGINTWFDRDNQQVCFYVECGVSNRIVVKAITPCDTISCEFTVNVECNQPPLVLLPPDTTIVLCGPDSIYIPVGINDPNHNLYSVNTPEWITYEPVSSRLAFYADTTGTYYVSVSAYDSCESSSSDQITVRVSLDEAPVCDMPDDTTVYLCQPGQISLPIHSSDDSQLVTNCSVVEGPGQVVNGYWVYQADSGGILIVVVECVDACNNICRDTFTVDIRLNEAPECNLPNDTTISQCQPSEICLPISADDVDGNFKSCTIISGPGAVANPVVKVEQGRNALGTAQNLQWCYTPTQDTAFTVVIKCEDSCGAFCIDSFTVSIDLNQAPVVDCRRVDNALSVCDLSPISLNGFFVSDPDGDELNVSISGGQLVGNTVTFTPVVGPNVIILSAYDICENYAACTTIVNVELNEAPVCLLPNDTTITGCVESEICLPVSYIDPEGNRTGCQIISGLGVIENGFWCYTPESNDTFTVTIRCIDDCEATCTDSFTVIFDAGTPPTIGNQYFAIKYCDEIFERQIQVEAAQVENDPTIFDLLAGSGSMDSLSGIINYLPDTPGVYSFIVEVSNTCGSNSAIIYDTVKINRAPEIVGFDSTVNLCSVEEICFDVFGFDPNNDSLNIQQVLGPGQFTQLSPNTGRCCFTPVKVDSAVTYLFVYQVTDLCENGAREVYQYYYDTVTITVILDKAPTLDLPPFDNIFACNPDSVCFRIPGHDSEDFPFEVEILSGNAVIYGDSIVCLMIDGAGDYNVVVKITDSCGNSSTYSRTFSVELNSPPQINFGEDFSIEACLERQVCVGFDVLDTDENIRSVLANYGTIIGTDSVCFDADTSGIYAIVVTAADSCGAIESDTITVTVKVNEPPFLSLGADISREVCAGDTICVYINVEDDNLAGIVANYFPQGNYICFTADSSGRYVVDALAYDSCDAETRDSVIITVTIPPAPFVDLGNDIRAKICAPQEFCIDVETIDNPASITFNRVGYNPETGQFCWTASGTILDLLKVTVTDSCGRVATDSISVYIQFNTAPQVQVAMRDTTFYLCRPSYICLPLVFADSQNNIADVQVNRGNYSNGQVCFVPYDSGTYTIIGTATDSCGAVTADTAVIRVLTDQYVNLECPNDTTVFMCTHDTLCFPIGEIPEWAHISVTGINTWYDEETQQVCFYVSCGVRNRIVVRAITPCDTISCAFTVDVRCNQPPLVLFPQDTTIVICGPDSVYIPVGTFDANSNIQSITVDNWAFYEPITSRVGFEADSEGVYILQVSVVDSCGASDFEDIRVTVSFNNPPQIAFTQTDSVFSLCAFEEICLPITFSDPDNNVTQIIPSIGYYNSNTRHICFTPADTFGLYCIRAIVIDACGQADTAARCITIINEGIVGMDCPTGPIYDTLCLASQICRALNIFGDPDSVKTNFGDVQNDQLCFYADTTGRYLISVSVFSPCTTITCQFDFRVTTFGTPTVSCPPNDTVLVCGPDTVYFQFSYSSVSTFSITPPAFISGNMIGLPVLASGIRNLTLIGSGQCGADTCSFFIDARLNTKPTVVSAPDTVLAGCILQQFCVPFTVSDPDNNVVSVVGPDGPITGNQYCFTPLGAGEYRIIIRAIDACGAFGVDTTIVRVSQTVADIFCPTGVQTRTVCRNDSVRITVPITPYEADVEVFLDGLPNGFYNRDSALIIVFPTTPGSHLIRIIASAGCVSDTCNISLFVNFLERTAITCPAVIDTFLCPVEVDSICFPVSVIGTNVQVTVSHGGRYHNGQACVPISQEGTSSVLIIGTGACGVDSCTTTINITADDPPILHLPADTVIELCDNDSDLICIDGIYVEDETPATLTKICGPGSFQMVTNDSGLLCFYPFGNFFGDYNFCFEVNDGCNSRIDTFKVTLQEAPQCNLCMVLSIDGGECIPVGRLQKVLLNIETFRPIGGFEILLSFDASVMAFSSALIDGTEIDGWEYFNYRINSGACAPVCPSGLVRLIGLAETNNGANHPPVETLSPNGVLVNLYFHITNDQNVGGQFLPINFVTYECADNTFSDPSGNDLYVDSKIYNSESNLIWDESNDVNFPESSRPNGMGTPDSCIVGVGQGLPKRCVEFINGGICTLHPDEIDDRGDINLNGVAYEVADAVVFTNYFIYGFAAFTVNIAGQIAASDVNADGIALSVADLVLLLRIIIGDAPPVPKINPHEIDLQLTNTSENGELKVSGESVNGIGGAYLVYSLNESNVKGAPELTSSTDQMELRYHIENNELRILIYSMNGRGIKAGEQELVTIPYEGNQPQLTRFDFADAEGRPYNAVQKNSELPGGFELHQNYPNPFNPSTTLSFGLPIETKWQLTVFNVTGATVRKFEGANEAGLVEVFWDGRSDNGDDVASGVYFYRLEARDFVATKKMIMLK